MRFMCLCAFFVVSQLYVACSEDSQHLQEKGSSAPFIVVSSMCWSVNAVAVQRREAHGTEVMNRFVVKDGSEKEFEERWAKRESKLLEASRPELSFGQSL